MILNYGSCVIEDITLGLLEFRNAVAEKEGTIPTALGDMARAAHTLSHQVEEKLDDNVVVSTKIFDDVCGNAATFNELARKLLADMTAALEKGDTSLDKLEPLMSRVQAIGKRILNAY